MRQLFSSVLIALLLGLTACQHQQAARQHSSSEDSLLIEFATGFVVLQHKDYQEVIVKSPWDPSADFATYYVVRHDSIVTPSDGVKIVTPVNSIALTSSTHIEFMQLLGMLDKIKGVCTPDLIYNATIRERFAASEIIDLGDAFNINVEKTLKLQPDILMMSGYKQDDPYAKRVIQAGIPVVYNNEWMEHSLLARAEWIKFVGVFLDKEEEADSIFHTVKESYLSVKTAAQSASYRPEIMSGSNFRGTWYMPGGGSYMAQLFADAGGDYYYAKDTTKGSLPLNVESVLKVFSATDVWLNCNFSTLQDLVQADSKHALFQPVANKRVYNFNKRMLPSTANDFWESAVARPDLLLKDVISILHPEVLPDHVLIYAEPLK